VANNVNAAGIDCGLHFSVLYHALEHRRRYSFKRIDTGQFGRNQDDVLLLGE